MKPFLATTGISDFWHIDGELILLGPWCMTEDKNKKLISGKAYFIMPSPWKPASKIKNTSDFCRNIYKDILPELSGQLNLVHGVCYPEKYWGVLIGPWLTQFVELLYEKYIRMNAAFTLFPEAHTYVLPKSLCKFLYSDMHDFFSKWSGSDLDNLKLFSLITHDLYPERAIEKDAVVSLTDRSIVQRTKFIKKIFYGIKKAKDFASHPSIILSDMYGFDFIYMFYLELKSCLGGVSFKNFDDIPQSSAKDSYSEEQRKQIKLKKTGDKFQDFLKELIPVTIPMCYMENYKIYKKRVKLGDIKAIGSATGWFYNESFKFSAAEAVLQNIRLLSFQHGGGYGMSLVCFPENIELRNGVFYTWGWSSGGDDTRILPNPYFSKIANSHLRRHDKILFIGTSIPKYSYMLHTLLLPDDMAKYNEDKKMFFKSLAVEMRNRILYKPYHYDYGWQEKITVQEALPKAEFLQKGKATKWMKRVKLVIIDHPHTSFLEALTINVPSVFYWDHNVFVMRPEAEEYFALLRNVGILHKDPVSAAKKVNEIFSDPMDWWLREDVQEARRKFCEHFACARNNWVDIWSCELKKITSGNQ